MGTKLNIILLLGVSFSILALSDSFQAVYAGGTCPVGQIFEPTLGMCIPEGTCPGGVDVNDADQCAALTEVINEEYKCYDLTQQLGVIPPNPQEVDLVDQFHVERDVQILNPAAFCASATKTMDDTHYVSPFTPFYGNHLTCYAISEDPPVDDQGNPIRVNIIDPQFGNLNDVEILFAITLCAPAGKESPPGSGMIDQPDPLTPHFKCYGIDTNGDINENIQLTDQFETLQDDPVDFTQGLCTPVLKFPDGAPADTSGLTIPDGPHFLFHGIFGAAPFDPVIPVTSHDQFGSLTFNVEQPIVLFSEVEKECLNCPDGGTGPGNGGGETAVGGDIIPLDTTMVLAAGAQYTAAWMIPVIVSAIGIGIVIARKF